MLPLEVVEEDFCKPNPEIQHPHDCDMSSARVLICERSPVFNLEALSVSGSWALQRVKSLAREPSWLQWLQLSHTLAEPV